MDWGDRFRDAVEAKGCGSREMPTSQTAKIVFCRLDGTFTVKRLKIENGVITLLSENRKHPPVTINEDAERYEQIGVVVGISRDLLR